LQVCPFQNNQGFRLCWDKLPNLLFVEVNCVERDPSFVLE
jgi:hypothetical protein